MTLPAHSSRSSHVSFANGSEGFCFLVVFFFCRAIFVIPLFDYGVSITGTTMATGGSEVAISRNEFTFNRHSIASKTWDASDRASGIYLCRLTGANQVSRVQKMVLIK